MEYAWFALALFGLLMLTGITSALSRVADAWQIWIAHLLDEGGEER